MATAKTALVTGSNKGIGYALVRELKALGYDVWLGARSPELGLTAATELGVHFLQLEVTDSASIATAVAKFSETNASLDLLINNAGVFKMGVDGQSSSATLQAMRETFEVNVFGVVSVTQAFLPLLKKATSAQVLNVSSGMGSQGLLADPKVGLSFPPMLAYSSSKAALNTFTILLASELKDAGIKVNSICPGYTATELNGNSGTQTTETSAKMIVSKIQAKDLGTGQFLQVDGTYPW